MCRRPNGAVISPRLASAIYVYVAQIMVMRPTAITAVGSLVFVAAKVVAGRVIERWESLLTF